LCGIKSAIFEAYRISLFCLKSMHNKVLLMESGLAIDVLRRIILAAMGGAIVSLGACGTALRSPDAVLDERLAGPCNRLILSWPEDPSRLRAMMGDGFEPSVTDGVGALHFTVQRCGPIGARKPPLTFAHLSVPIEADSVPLVVTRMPDEGWAWLPFLIVDAESSGVFVGMGYVTLAAEIDFEVDSTQDSPSIATQLTFEGGRISITATTDASKQAHTAHEALVTKDVGYYSVFFGKETGERYPSVSADLDSQGSNPLAAAGILSQPGHAIFDTELRPDQVYWRLPRPREVGQ
jgi:hypothetical protein